MPDIARLVVLAPNWLGDVVMAMPLIADMRRAFPEVKLFVAARPGVAGILPFVPALDGTIVFDGRSLAGDAHALASERFDAALLLPNAFRAAWLAWRAGIRRRWGYRGDGRSWLLTNAIRRPAWPYRQVDYYQRLGAAVGAAPGPSIPHFSVPARVADAARGLLRSRGFRDGDRLVVFAPGTAKSTSKQWIPEYVATLIGQLSNEGIACVLVGGAGDAEVGRVITSSLKNGARGHFSRTVIDLIGETTIELLVGILKTADVVVGNDSGAMHLAAGLGTKVVATFGPTNEEHSPPLAHADARAIVVTNEVWCRPCMLMETCPIDHSCMTGITPDRVHAAVHELL